MDKILRSHADAMVAASIRAVQPDEAVSRALAAAQGIAGIPGTAVFSVGSDGTDGPTDAAGGYVDYETAGQLKAAGIAVYDVLQDNDAYHALEKTGGLIITGPTGTNVNDVAMALLNG